MKLARAHEQAATNLKQHWKWYPEAGSLLWTQPISYHSNRSDLRSFVSICAQERKTTSLRFLHSESDNRMEDYDLQPREERNHPFSRCEKGHLL